jgi:hypothetical protein
MKDKITHETALCLWNRLADEYFSSTVRASTKNMQRAIHWALDAMGVESPLRFLKHHGLTIIETIHVPFVPGAASRQWTPVDQVLLAVHEHHHVWQAEEYGGIVYAAGYLTKPQMRAHLEAEAYRATMELQQWLTGETPSAVQYSKDLIQYGCGTDEVRYCNSFLEQSLSAIHAGRIQSPVAQLAIDWLSDEKNLPGPS